LLIADLKILTGRYKNNENAFIIAPIISSGIWF